MLAHLPRGAGGSLHEAEEQPLFPIDDQTMAELCKTDRGRITAPRIPASARPGMDLWHLLGERLYPLVHAQQPERAGKITGMLLELDPYEVKALIEDEEARMAKVQEAIEVLEGAGC